MPSENDDAITCSAVLPRRLATATRPYILDRLLRRVYKRKLLDIEDYELYCRDEIGSRDLNRKNFLVPKALGWAKKSLFSVSKGEFFDTILSSCGWRMGLLKKILCL